MSQTPSKRIGSISIVEDAACVQFRYNTDCFRAISKIPGASYSKESKTWKIALIHLPKLLESKSFKKGAFEYNFDEYALKEKFSVLHNSLVLARERTQKNPFSVSESDLSLISFDIVFRQCPLTSWIVLRVGKSQRARRYLKSSLLVHYAKRAKGYVTTAAQLTELLKTLRDKEISFAVSSDLSKLLEESANTRAAFLRSERFGDLSEYRSAMLYPILDSDAQCVKVIGMTAELRAKLVPAQSNQKNRGDQFSKSESLRIAYRAKQHEIKLWRTRALDDEWEVYRAEAKQEIYQCFERFRDELLVLFEPDICWRLSSDGYGGIQIANDVWKTGLGKIISKQVSEFGGSIVARESYFACVHAVKLPLFFEAVQKILQGEDRAAAVSRDFRLLLEVVRKRAEILDEQRRFHEMKDTSLMLHDNEIASKLYPHQRVAVSWLLGREYGMLGDDMGLGKTLSVLVTFAELLSKSTTDFLLVICPNSLVNNWLREAAHWVPHIKLKRLPETKRERTEVLAAISEGRYESIDGLVINFEAMRTESVWPLLQTIAQKRKTFLCVDESQRIKNPQSQSFQAMREIAAMCRRRVLLSGTPTPRDISDIWGQMLILDNGERFGRSFYGWLATVAELGTQWSDYAVKKFIPSGVEETIARVHEVLLRRKKEEVVQLPEKIFLFRDVELSGDQKKRFEQVRDELRVQVRTLSGEVGSKVIESILEQYLRAVQVASNPRLIDPTWEGEPAKFKELDDIVEDIVKERGEKLVIWTNYLGNISELTERYKSFGAKPFSGLVSTEERSKTIAAFQSDREDSPKILVAVPAAGGVGITLTAAQTAVYIDRTWNAEHWLQSIDRIHRIGQKATARIIVLNATKVDELIGFNLKKKSEQMEKVLSGVGALDQLLLPTVAELLEALG